ncbi:pyrroloquinoline quinone biosynthesis protein D [Gammaproteobacteria bacterium]
MNRTDNPIVNPIVVLREESDEWAILFNPDTADAVVINPVGVAVWKMMDGQRRFKDIVLEIKTRFANASEAAFEEIVAFVDKLVERNYVGYDLKIAMDDGKIAG